MDIQILFWLHNKAGSAPDLRLHVGLSRGDHIPEMGTILWLAIVRQLSQMANRCWDQLWQWLCSTCSPLPTRHLARSGYSEAAKRWWALPWLFAKLGYGQKSQGCSGWCLDFLDTSCSLDFLGLTGSMLSDEAASLIAGDLNTLPALSLAAKAETVEILQIALSKPAWNQLQTAGERARVKVLLSLANGQALWLRIRRQINGHFQGLPSHRRDIGRAAAAGIEPGSFAQALRTLLVSKKGQNMNKYTTLSTWRDYGPGPLGPPLILW